MTYSKSQMEKMNLMKLLSLLIVVITVVGMTGNCQSPNKHNATIKGTESEVVPFRAITFNLEDVKLLDGPFKHATELDEKVLLNYEPDRFLARFRIESGLEPKAEQYHGWEDKTIAGHSLGHYLTSLCLMYKTTGDKVFKERADYIVKELGICQKANENGYLGAFENGEKILEGEIAKGDIRSYGFTLNDLWVPYYTQHKVLDGLIHAYKLCDNKEALDIAVKFTDWLYLVVKDLNDEQIQRMLNCEYGGINDVLAELYGITGEQKYLDMSWIFHDKAVVVPISEHKDILAGKHANTQIPKFVGTARRYELTGNKKDYEASEFFWDRVVHHHSYVTGGNCNHEYFGQPDSLRDRLSDGTTETCNVYNMLKLSKHLFQWEAKAEVADFYERALFNHILSSQHPENGRVIYNLSLEMGGYKVYQDPQWFTCCVGTGMENHAKYGKNIYYHNDDELFISQFIASELNWKEKGIKLTQKTKYPEEQGTTLVLDCDKPVNFTLNVRYPGWSESGIQILVNDKAIKIDEKPQSFIAIKRKWKAGDEVKISIPFKLRLESMPDDKNRVAVMYGPLVLAGDLGPENDPKASDLLYVPVLMTSDRNPEEWLTKVDGKPNTFKSNGIGRPKDVLFRPFYSVHERIYSVYFDLFTQDQWSQQKAEYMAKQEQLKKLQRMTIDYCKLGEMQPERDHNFKEDKSWVEELKHVKYREADRGGWFSFEMGTYAGQPMSLVLEYYGGLPGSRTFDIYVNDHKLATENLSNANTGEFFNKEYDLPDELTISGGLITVKLVPKDGHRAGPVSSARIIKR